jgi:hypothetical protein
VFRSWGAVHTVSVPTVPPRLTPANCQPAWKGREDVTSKFAFVGKSTPFALSPARGRPIPR